jgi:hypothetical protein
MIDASDLDSFTFAKSELNVASYSSTVLTFDQIVAQIPEWKIKPILILGNKIDRSTTAVTEAQLQAALSLTDPLSKSLKIKIQMCSIVRRVGYGSGQTESCISLLCLLSHHHDTLPRPQMALRGDLS